MKRFLLSICLVILITSTLFIIGAKGQSSNSVEAELKLLRSQVKSLEKRVAKLETKVPADRSLESQPRTQRPQVPKGWQRRDFNGIPFYTIPLNQNSQNRTKTITKP
jgi:hypothetical protein